MPTSPLASLLPLWHGGLGPVAGLGPSLLAVFCLRATGPLALFSASHNTIKAFLRPRERLQSASLWLFGGFLSLDSGKAVEGRARPGRSQLQRCGEMVI